MSEGKERRCGRRSFLKALGAGAGATVALAGCIAPPPSVTDGGGVGAVPGGAIPHQQAVSREDADYVVEEASVLAEHIAATANGGTPRVIWIPNDAKVDMTGRDGTLRNITVASGRTEGVSGGLIFSNSVGSDSVNYWGGSNGNGCLDIAENGRLTGVRLRGPTYDYYDSPAIPGWIHFAPGGPSAREAWRSERHSRGITLLADSAQVDNCEIFGWSTQAIAVGNSATRPEPTISHCAIHNNCMTSFGYGVDVRRGNPIVYKCWFDGNRHHLNGHGNAHCGYRAIDCVFGPHATSHLIDMHQVGDNEDGSSDPNDPYWTHRAGGYMLVQGCQIQATHNIEVPGKNHASGRPTSHAKIRGIPAQGFVFKDNLCAHGGPPNNDEYAYSSPINQTGIEGSGESPDENGYVNVFFSGNAYNVNFDLKAAHQPKDSPYYTPELA